MQGLAEGAGQCIHGFGDMLRGMYSLFVEGEYAKAAQLMGLSPGKSITLEAIRQEVEDSANRSRMSPRQAGMVGGRRFCAYGLIAGVTHAATKARGKIPPPGQVPARPLVPDRYFMKSIAESPQVASGQWVRTARGPLKLGDWVGSGEFGAIYEDGARPGQVIKVSRVPEGAETFPRQVQGTRALERAGVDTVRIHDYIPPENGGAGFLRMDHVDTHFPGAVKIGNYFEHPERLGIREAAERGYRDIARINHVAPDLHFGNAYFRNTPSGWRMVVVDADMIVPYEDLYPLRGSVGNSTGFLLQKAGLSVADRFSASELMQTFLDVRFGAPGTGTVPH